MSKSAIDDWMKTISKMIKVSYDVGASVSDHSTILGDARESFIRDVLERFLPSSITIGSGQIIDQHGDRSKQVDIIIYRREFPILKTYGPSDVYLIEGVIAAIEVKSSLNEQSLKMALENLKSVKNLVPDFLPESLAFSYKSYFNEHRESNLNQSQLFSFKQMIAPETYIFSYYGQKLKTTKKHLEKWFVDKNGADSNSYYLPEAISTDKIAVTKDLNGVCIPKDEGNSLGIRKDEYSLRFIINPLLEQIMRRIGSPQYASTGLQYNILGYSLKAEGIDKGWSGFLKNKLKIRDLTTSLPEYRDIAFKEINFLLQGESLFITSESSDEKEEGEIYKEFMDSECIELFSDEGFKEFILNLTIVIIYCSYIKKVSYISISGQLINPALEVLFDEENETKNVFMQAIFDCIAVMKKTGTIEIEGASQLISISHESELFFKELTEKLRAEGPSQLKEILHVIWDDS